MTKMVKTIRQLLDGKLIHKPDNADVKELVLELLNMGFTDDYIPSYNVFTFGLLFIKRIKFRTEPEQKDFLWLCNKLSSHVSKNKLSNVHTLRAACLIPGRFTPVPDIVKADFYFGHWHNAETDNTYGVAFTHA